jgi:hypothetical protein
VDVNPRERQKEMQAGKAARMAEIQAAKKPKNKTRGRNKIGKREKKKDINIIDEKRKQRMDQLDRSFFSLTLTPTPTPTPTLTLTLTLTPPPTASLTLRLTRQGEGEEGRQGERHECGPRLRPARPLRAEEGDC